MQSKVSYKVKSDISTHKHNTEQDCVTHVVCCW